MSGILGALSNALGYDNPTADEVSIVVGETSIVGWETVSITRSVESYPNSFVLTAMDQFPNDPKKSTVLPDGPGYPCQIKIRKDVVVTGFVDNTP